MNKRENCFKKNICGGGNYAGKIFFMAFIMSFLVFLPFLISDHGFFLYYGDYNAQQIPFYTIAHRAVRSGSLFFNITTDLGSSVYTSYSFYLLGSPFFWLTVPFPETAIPYLMPYLLMLKIALASMNAFLYIKRYVQEERVACIGGLLYGFSGFQMVSLVFNHFLDVTAFFPLYLILLEKCADEKKHGRFALGIAFMAILNYYFFVGEVLFLIAYALLKYGAADGKHSAKEKGKTLLRLCAEGGCGILISCFFLLPSLYAASGNYRVSNTVSWGKLLRYADVRTYGTILKNLFLPPDLIASGTMFVTDEGKVASVSLFLPLFAVSGVIAFLWKSQKNRFLKRMFFCSLAAMLLPVCNAAFSAFNAVYYARWFYMPLLLMALMTACAIEEFDAKAFGIGISVMAAVLVLFVVFGVMSGYVSGKLYQVFRLQNRNRYNMQLVAAGGCLIVLCALVFLWKSGRKKSFLNVMLFSTILVSSVLFYQNLSLGHGLVSAEGRTNYREQITGEFKLLEKDGEQFYRVETDRSRANVMMFHDIPSVSCFLSTVSNSIMDFYAFAGIERTVESRIPYDRMGIRALLSVKYFLQNEGITNDTAFVSDGVLAGYKKTGNENGFGVYENENCLSMGTLFSHYMTVQEYEKLTERQKDQVLVYAPVIEDEETLCATAAKAGITLQALTADEFIKGGMKDSGEIKEQCERLNETAAEKFSYNKEGMELTYWNTQGGLMLLSVPYSSGFSVMIDGIAAEIQKADGGLMVVCVPESASQVVFRYREPGLTVGIVLSLFGITGLAAEIIAARRKGEHL